eukprot:jgi/Galph1/2934/GphlegSOOS_G1635.1
MRLSQSQKIGMGRNGIAVSQIANTQMLSSRLQRAKQQRLYLLTQTGNVESLEVKFAILGSTGNVYTVWFENQRPRYNCFDQRPRCNCFDQRVRILKVPEERIEKMTSKPLTRQELRHFLNSLARPVREEYLAPVNVIEEFQKAVGDLTESAMQPRLVAMRQTTDAECPICFEPLSTEEPVVYCKWGCGNAIHRDCFDKWSASKVNSGGLVTCVLCRAPWEQQKPNEKKRKLILSSSGHMLKLKNPYEKENVQQARASYLDAQNELNNTAHSDNKRKGRLTARKTKQGEAGSSKKTTSNNNNYVQHTPMSKKDHIWRVQ